MTPSTFYKLLVKVEFVETSNIKYSLCNQHMRLIVNNDEANNVKQNFKKDLLNPLNSLPYAVTHLKPQGQKAVY